MKKLMNTYLLAGLAMLSATANAAVITSVGAGTAVNTVTRQATFTGISGSLQNYTEGGVTVSVNEDWCCFNGVHYGAGGNSDYVTITTPDSIKFAGLELDLGTGFADGLHNVVWETLRDGTATGSGLIQIFASNGLANGFSVLGWADVNLFDTLRIGASPTSTGYNAFGQYQAIALDNVKIGSANAVPEPGTLAILAIGLVGLGLTRRTKT